MHKYRLLTLFVICFLLSYSHVTYSAVNGIQIKFRGQTLDEIANYGVGFLIDNVKIYCGSTTLTNDTFTSGLDSYTPVNDGTATNAWYLYNNEMLRWGDPSNASYYGEAAGDDYIVSPLLDHSVCSQNLTYEFDFLINFQEGLTWDRPYAYVIIDGVETLIADGAGAGSVGVDGTLVNDNQWHTFSFSDTDGDHIPDQASISNQGAPTASNVSISGTAIVGEQLSGTYSYNDDESDFEGTSTFRWVRNSVNSGVSGGADVATTQNYTVVSADINNYLYFCVTPVAATGTSPGTEVCSAASAQVAANDAPTASSVSLTGTAKEGEVLTGSYTYGDTESDAEDTGATGSSYRFVSSTDNSVATAGDNSDVGTGDTGGNADAYTLASGDVNKYVFYCVTPKASAGTSPGTEVCSAASAQVAANDAPTASSVSLTGTAKEGEVLTGSYTYGDTESDAEDTGATGSSYRFVSSTDNSVATAGDNSDVGTGDTGGNADAYTLASGDVNKYVFYCVTPKASAGTSPGTEVCSAASVQVAAAPVVPDAPTIGAGMAANSSAIIAFTAPVNNGGSVIIDYTASCNGSQATGTGSPITVTGLSNGTTYSCSVTARNSAGISAASATVSVTPLDGGIVILPPTVGSGSGQEVTYTFTSTAAGTLTIVPTAATLPTPTDSIAAGSLYGAVDITSTSPGNPGYSIAITFNIAAGSNAFFVGFWKYGPENGGADHWYDYGTLTANGDGTGYEITNGGKTLIVHLTDGVRGDDDLLANGTIIDAGMPITNAADVQQIPTLSFWGLLALSGLLALFGFRQLPAKH